MTVDAPTGIVEVSVEVSGGTDLPDMPWEDRPPGESRPLWRYSGNPVIPRDLLAGSNSVFNSAVVPFGGGYAGVFRCDDRTRTMQLHRGFSDDGLTWVIDADPIELDPPDAELARVVYRYDPRIAFIGDRFYLTWCNWYHGPTIGVAWTRDFEHFQQLENAFLPFNRNGVLFPKRVGDRFAMLSRPSDAGHTPFGDVFYSESPDLTFWGRHRHVLGTIANSWQSTKVGAGPVPLETTAGWLLVYHGVLTSCNGFVYSLGTALLDRERPWIVVARSAEYLLSPQEQYECVGDVPNVVFPTSMLCDSTSRRLAIYYGAADTTTALAFGYVDELVRFTIEHSITP